MRLQGIPSWTFPLCLGKILTQTFMLEHIPKRYSRAMCLLGNTSLIYQARVERSVYIRVYKLLQTD